MHSLRQRYGANLVHTHAGPNMVVINPISSPSMYSEKASCSLCKNSLRKAPTFSKREKDGSNVLLLFFQVMQMFKGCRKEDTAPHIYGTAQAAYRHLLTTRQDQSIILLGKSGSGKTTNCQHIIQYLLTIAGSANKTFSGWSNWPKFQVRISFVIQVLFVVRSREMAGGLHRVRGIWERVHLSEWKCQSLLPCCFFGLWPGRSGDFGLHSGIFIWFFLHFLIILAYLSSDKRYYPVLLLPCRRCFWRRPGWREDQKERRLLMSFTSWWLE